MDHVEAPSDTDDDEDEHLDFVHDIHNDGEEADVEEIDGDEEIELTGEHGVNLVTGEEIMDVDRPLVNDSSMDGDIEDGDGQDTDRRFPKRASLFNKLNGIEHQSSVDSDHQYKKKPTVSNASKQFPLNQMRRR